MNSSEIYFANLPPSDIVAELGKRFRAYRNHCDDRGLSAIWGATERAYFRGVYGGSDLVQVGEQGELTKMFINQLRSYIQHVLVLTTSTRPAFDPKAVNTDQESLAHCILAQGLLDYYMRAKRLERYLIGAVELGLHAGEGWIYQPWDTMSGKDVAADPNTNTIVKEGDMVFHNLHPRDVARDFTKRSGDEHQWYIVRTQANKFDLAAQFPEQASDILGSNPRDENEWDDRQALFKDISLTDQVNLYEFYHLDTPGCPGGKMVKYIQGLRDPLVPPIEMPYQKLPAFRVTSGNWQDTCFGYSPTFDALPLQYAYDGIASTIMTNIIVGGPVNILAPRAAGVDQKKLEGGANLVEYDGESAPGPLNLIQIPRELPESLEMFGSLMGQIFGINDAVRGDVNAGDSGSKDALQVSQAIQYNSGLQNSYARLVEDVGTDIIEKLQKFANSKRVAEISGKSNRYYLKEFSGSDLSLVTRVVVDVGSSASKTVEGRLQLVQMLAQYGQLENAQQIITLLDTGRWEPIFENQIHEITNIKSENEALSDVNGPLPRTPQQLQQDPNTGQVIDVGSKPIPPVHAVFTDHPIKHIMEHRDVLSSPEARRNPNIVEAVQVHIDDHIMVWRNTDPALLQLMGFPMPPPPPPPPGIPPPGAQSHTQAPQPGATSQTPPPGAVSVHTASGGEHAQRLPSLPKNPLTGRQFDPATGGRA